MSEGTVNEEELVRRWRLGDRAAFEGVVQLYHPGLQELAWRMTGDREEARDIGQAALVRAWETVATFRGTARLSTWLYRVVLNLCRDQRRKRRVRDDALALADAPDEALPAADGPEGRGRSREAAQRVADAVRALPPLEREVVVLRHYHDLSFAEIAAVQDAPVSTVKSRMTRGLELLRRPLEELKP